MIFKLNGIVIGVEERGFRIRTSDEADCLVRTLLPGKEIKLDIGDRVSVSGGPGRDHGTWASSSCYKELPDGRQAKVRINPDDRLDQNSRYLKTAVTPEAPGLWTRIKSLFRYPNPPTPAVVKPSPALAPGTFDSGFPLSIIMALDADRPTYRSETPARTPLEIPEGVRWWVEPNAPVHLESLAKELASLHVPGLSLWEVKDDDLEPLVGLTELRWLTLVHAGITDVGLASLASLLNLEALQVWSAPVSGAGLTSLACLTQLRELDLSGSQVTEQGLAGLEGLIHLQALRLRATPLVDGDLAHLMPLMAMRRLNLCRTKVTDAGIAHLRGLTGLQQLDLSSTCVIGESARLEDLSSLVALNLSDTPLTDKGLTHLTRLRELRTLALVNTRVTGMGLDHLSELLNLEEVSLSSAHVTEVGILHLGLLKGLKKINLHRASPNCLAAVHASLPHCRVTNIE